MAWQIVAKMLETIGAGEALQTLRRSEGFGEAEASIQRIVRGSFIR